MVAAAETAREHGYPLFLGDQGIDATSSRLKEAFVDSLRDLLTLRWVKLGREIKKSYMEAVYVSNSNSNSNNNSNSNVINDRYLGYSDFFETALLLFVPVSLVRYPLALFLKAPKFSFVLMTVLFLISMMDTDMSTPLSTALSALGVEAEAVGGVSPTAEAVTSMMTSLLILVSEIALLGRPFLTGAITITIIIIIIIIIIISFVGRTK